MENPYIAGWSDSCLRVHERHRALVLVVSQEMHRFGLTAARETSARALVAMYQQLSEHFEKLRSDAHAQCERLRRDGAAVELGWHRRVADERYRAIANACDELARQLAWAEEQHRVAKLEVAEFTGRERTGAAVLEGQIEELRQVVIDHGNALLAGVNEENAIPSVPTSEELKAIRRKIREDDWSDLPAYHGADTRTARECQYCGAELGPERRRFCSVQCHRAFAEVYGTASRPKRELRDGALE